MLLTEKIGIEKSIERISGIRTIQNGGRGINWVFTTPKWILRISNLITKYKHEDLYLTTNTNVKLKKKKNSSNDVSLAASAILFRKLCRLFHSIFGRDGRGSKSGRRPIEHTGIVIPIPAALPLAKTNRLLEYMFTIRRAIHTFKGNNSKSVFFFFKIMPHFRLDFFPSIKHLTAERWHPHAVLWLYNIIK